MLRLARETLRDPGEVRRKLERAVRIVFKRPRTHYARSGQLNIAYQVLGEGPIDLVVVPPGLAIMDTSWEDDALSAFWSALAAFSRLILLDKRGTGLSDRVTGVPTLEERMDDVRVVMEAVGSERAALLGGSEAAPITALFVATYPERTSALVLSMRSSSGQPVQTSLGCSATTPKGSCSICRAEFGEAVSPVRHGSRQAWPEILEPGNGLEGSSARPERRQPWQPSSL